MPVYVWCILHLYVSYREVFFTGSPQSQYQKENPPSSQSRQFLVLGFTGTAALIGWLAVFFLVLKFGATSEEEKTTLYIEWCYLAVVILHMADDNQGKGKGKELELNSAVLKYRIIYYGNTSMYL